METIIKELQIELNSLIGQKITTVVSGEPVGSIILIDIGEWNVLFIYSVWRLTDNGTVLATWRDSNEIKEGNLVIQTQLLTNDVIDSVNISEFFDLTIHTISGRSLDVFCDIGPKNTDDFTENWCLANKKNNVYYSINSSYKVKILTYDTSLPGPRSA